MRDKDNSLKIDGDINAPITIDNLLTLRTVPKIWALDQTYFTRAIRQGLDKLDPAGLDKLDPAAQDNPFGTFCVR